jgi:hypothetical protein
MPVRRMGERLTFDRGSLLPRKLSCRKEPMGFKELKKADYEKLVAHHDARSKWYRKSARSNSSLADAHQDEPVKAQHYRDRCEMDKAAADEHEQMRDHFESQGEKLNAASHAELFDNRADETQGMHASVGTADLLKRFTGDR